MRKNARSLSITIIFALVLILSTTAICFGVSVTNGSVEQALWISENPANTSVDVKLKLDGIIIPTDVAPVIVMDRTLVPARAVFEAAGGEVIWVPEFPSDIGIEYNEKLVTLKIGSSVAAVDGIEMTMDVPAQLFPGDRTLIPVRFVAENLGFEVDWEQDTTTVILDSGNTKDPPTPETPPTDVIPPTAPGISDPKLGDVENIDLEWTGSHHRVTITCNQPILDYEVVGLENPNRFYIDLKGFDFKEEPEDITIEDIKSAVPRIRSSQFEDNTARIVMDLREMSSPNVSLSIDKKSIYIDFLPITFEPYADGKLVVMIDPGHGITTAGKRSFDESLMEYEFNRDVANRLGTILEANGIEVKYTVTSNDDVSLKDRCAISNASDADIFVSIHANAFGTTDWNKINGWETYIYREGGYAEELAKEIEKASIPSLGLANRGVKDSDFYVVKYTNVPAVLIEHGFYTNLEELEKLKSSEFRQQLAEADAEGIINFFNKYK